MSRSQKDSLQDDYKERPSPPPYEEHHMGHNSGQAEAEVRGA